MHEFDGVNHFHDEGGEIVLGTGDEVIWTSVGIDVGSATSQIVFSRIVLVRDDARYVVADRRVLHESEVILTPYAASDVIDAATLGAFADREYKAAGLTRDDIDTGAVILTGLALSTSNARAIADAVADESGRFVAVSAGDALEARLAASGAGAAFASSETDGILVHIDIGGGTTKFSAWSGGELLSLAAIDVGARLVTFDGSERVARIEDPAQRIIDVLKLDIAVGKVPAPGAIEKLAETMAEDVLRQAGIVDSEPRWPHLLRTAPLFDKSADTIPTDHSGPHFGFGQMAEANDDVVTSAIFSGGVSEYIYGREEAVFGDIGLALGRAVRRAVTRNRVRLLPFTRGIRATVLGVSQYSVQLSGNTVFVSDETLLPLRNVPVAVPDYDFTKSTLDESAMAASISRAHAVFAAGPSAAATAIVWGGSATYERLAALTRAIVSATEQILPVGAPVIVILDGDIAGVLGMSLKEEAARPVICLDGVEAGAFDHIDIGAFAGKSRALPVVVKSLLFAK